jgi:hypothetical protein
VTNDSFFAVLLTSTIALFFGFVLAFSGYRFFLILLPIWGFFFGFGLGAQSMQAIFGEGFLSTVSSWVVGFVIAAAFAFASYFFFAIRIGITAFSLGYAVGVGLMEMFGLNFGVIAWLVGVVLGGAVIIGTFAFKLYKYIIIAATSILGAGVVVGTFLYMFGGLPSAQLIENPVRVALQTSPFWFIMFLVVAALGAAAQFTSTRYMEAEIGETLAGLSADNSGGQAPPGGQTPPGGPPPPAEQPTQPGQTPPAGQPIAG